MHECTVVVRCVVAKTGQMAEKVLKALYLMNIHEMASFLLNGL
ncbi:hypothetical protein PCH70_01960 [Pseudomonas cichorii JBC1]|nr:hypothetical protein PCH70_01960 [Pseudomonas cichorii JBC1]